MGLLSRAGRHAARLAKLKSRGFDLDRVLYRGGARGDFVTPDAELALRFARGLHGSSRVEPVAVRPGRQMVVDWAGRPWDNGPSGWSTDAMKQMAKRDGYDTLLMQNVESVRGSPADEIVVLSDGSLARLPRDWLF